MGPSSLVTRLGLPTQPELDSSTYRLVRRFRAGAGRHTILVVGILFLALVLVTFLGSASVGTSCSDLGGPCETTIVTDVTIVQAALAAGLVLGAINGIVNLTMRIQLRRRGLRLARDARALPTTPRDLREGYESAARALVSPNAHEPQMRGAFLLVAVATGTLAFATLVLVAVAYGFLLATGGIRFDGSTDDRHLTFSLLGAFTTGILTWRALRRTHRFRRAARELADEANAALAIAATRLRQTHEGHEPVPAAPITFRPWNAAAGAAAMSPWPKPK